MSSGPSIILVDLPMERYPNFVEQKLQVLATNVLLRRIAELIKHFAAGSAGLRVDARKGNIVVSGLEVILLLLAELEGKVGQDRYICGVRRTP